MLYHATNLGNYKKIVESGAIIGKLFSIIECAGLLGGTNSSGLDVRVVGIHRRVCLADSPELASALSDYGADVVLKVCIPRSWVRDHHAGPGSYETIPEITEITLNRVQEVIASIPSGDVKETLEARNKSIPVSYNSGLCLLGNDLANI